MEYAKCITRSRAATGAVGESYPFRILREGNGELQLRIWTNDALVDIRCVQSERKMYLKSTEYRL
jgi:hypothetical protein